VERSLSKVPFRPTFRTFPHEKRELSYEKLNLGLLKKNCSKNISLQPRAQLNSGSYDCFVDFLVVLCSYPLVIFVHIISIFVRSKMAKLKKYKNIGFKMPKFQNTSFKWLFEE
jgi:hypothetical protein